MRKCHVSSGHWSSTPRCAQAKDLEQFSFPVSLNWSFVQSSSLNTASYNFHTFLPTKMVAAADWGEGEGRQAWRSARWAADPLSSQGTDSQTTLCMAGNLDGSACSDEEEDDEDDGDVTESD